MDRGASHSVASRTIDKAIVRVAFVGADETAHLPPPASGKLLLRTSASWLGSGFRVTRLGFSVRLEILGQGYDN